jgi:hypothetical protein
MPGGDKSFLREVFAVRQATRRTVSQRTDQGLVAPYDLRKRLAIARNTGGDERGIVGLCGEHWSGKYHITAYVAKTSREVTKKVSFENRTLPLCLKPLRFEGYRTRTLSIRRFVASDSIEVFSDAAGCNSTLIQPGLRWSNAL